MPTRIGLPQQLDHLDWEEGVYEPRNEPGKKIPYLRVVVQSIGAQDQLGYTGVQVTATRYPKSFRVDIEVSDQDGDGYDPESFFGMNRRISAFNGAVEEFERDFIAIRDRVRTAVMKLAERDAGMWLEEDETEPYFDGWHNPPTRLNDDGDTAYQDDDNEKHWWNQFNR